MKPDPVRPGLDDDDDEVERAHLREPDDQSHTIHRYAGPPDVVDLVRSFWVPVWSVPPGEEAVQRVLQHPVALAVVSSEYATFRGVASGLSSVSLAGEGWAVGVMFQPAAGFLLTGSAMVDWTDRAEDLADALGPGAPRVVEEVRGAMGDDPHAVEAHGLATDALADLARAVRPVDDEGRLVNDVVACIERRSDITAVAQVCEELGLTERALQRLTRRRLGLPPRWLIQRRRLHEASGRLRQGGGSLAAVAAELGYADQPHFTRDFRTVTGMTPGRFAARYRT